MPLIFEVRGLKVVVFLYELQAFVMLGDDLEERDIVYRAGSEILNEIREAWGKEIRGISYMVPLTVGGR